MGNGRVKNRPFIAFEQRSIAHIDIAANAEFRAAQAVHREMPGNASTAPREFSVETKIKERHWSAAVQ